MIKYVVVEIGLDLHDNDNTVSKDISKSAFLGGAYIEILLDCQKKKEFGSHSHYEIWEEIYNDPKNERKLIKEVFGGEIDTMFLKIEKLKDGGLK